MPSPPCIPTSASPPRPPTVTLRAALSIGPSYHLLQFDATARWNFNEYLQLFGRYQFVYQARVGQVVPSQSPLLDFTRHVVLVGLTFMYPRR